MKHRPLAATSAESWRFLLAVGAAGMLIVALGLGLLFGLTPYQVLADFGKITYHENGFTHLKLALTPARYYWLLALMATVGAGALITLWRLGSRPFNGLRHELQLAAAQQKRWWQRQSSLSLTIAASTLLALIVIRVWYLIRYPLGTDEVASYDYFVRGGLRIIISFYPIPNNHIFYNLLAWPLAQLGISPRLVMRLPTLIGGTMGTAMGYALLARLVGWRRATLVVGLLGVAPLWAYYAAVGRGYFLQFCLLQIGFFAAVELLQPASPYQRLSWLAFVGSSVLGLYTIPTYAYPLAALGLGLGAGLAGQRDWARVGHLLLASIIIACLVALLYTPVGTVSGWDQLLANRYVATRTAAQFWPHYRATLYEMAADLFGPPVRLSGPAWLALAALGGVAAWRFVPAGPRRTLALLAWAQLALPLLLMAAQRIYAPTRVVLYLTFFGYLLVLLLIEQLPWPRWRLPISIRWAAVLAVVVGFGSFQLYKDQTQVQAARRETQQFEQTFTWLNAHARLNPDPTRVWLNAPWHELFFSHYVKLARTTSGGFHYVKLVAPQLLLRSGHVFPRPGTYEFLILNTRPGSTNTPPPHPYQAVYHDELVTIYTAPPAPIR